MEKLLAVIIGSILLTACGSDDSADTSTTGNGLNNDGNTAGNGPLIETHRVCDIVKDNKGDDILTANEPINNGENWLLIESMSEASAEMANKIKTLPEDEQFEAAFASVAFLAPSIADIFTGLNIIYTCTEAMYSLNQCNWDDIFQEDGNTKVDTVVGSAQSFITTVSSRADATASFQTITVLQGTIGDLGNLTLEFYEHGVNVGSRQATRTSDGTETVRFTSTKTNWVATETANCTGSLEYEDIRDDDTISVNAQWRLSGSNTSGTLDYQNTNSSVSLDW